MNLFLVKICRGCYQFLSSAWVAFGVIGVVFYSTNGTPEMNRIERGPNCRMFCAFEANSVAH